MLKKILALCLCLSLVGCGKINYERSTEPGVIKEITMADVQNKIDNKKTSLELDEIRMEQIKDKYYNFEKFNNEEIFQKVLQIAIKKN